jgi:hypothetical protein
MRIKIMPRHVPFVVPRLITVLAVLLILKVTLGIVYEYRNYLPPNFQSDFLLGRESHFWGTYSWAFYVHVISSPVALLLCTLLMSNRLRNAAPTWHRRLGRAQAICTLLFVVPSGLWMAPFAATGAVAAGGLSLLAVATGASVACGWRAALGQRWERHRWWMWRTFALLCSAVVLRLLGGLAAVAQIEAQWAYPASIWISWLGPLTLIESARIWFSTVRE